ncbi:MAG TPA: DEAD/DEAH box helicase [Polyangiaceae bacterium]|nr:DEAD/DEAH box helicase [Polyangiaceae bacterium]
MSELLGPELSAAIAKKGYLTLTPVQLSVLDPALRDRDLRVSSQTGSGKTLAIGFALRDVLRDAAPASKAHLAKPAALVIVPTRELAKQVEAELSWLFAPFRLKIAAVTGGASYRDEHRALASNPAIVVGTPGRLLDHLQRGGVDPSAVRAVVLDEADRMLDLGFRDELEAILATTPSERFTHLVSATFSPEVKRLADSIQKNPARVEGTPLGSANSDIEHVVYVVRPGAQVDALVNVLLEHPNDQTLVFARTRAEVADITRELQSAGFAAGALSGEMEQLARNRALAAFKQRDVRVLVATDVAARGIDVQDIARVVQIDAPTDPDTYTHRSGRTGRAGRKGTSAIIIPPHALRRTLGILERARVRYRTLQVPNAEAIRAAQDARWLAELTEASRAQTEISPRIRAQVTRIIESGLAESALALLLSRSQKALGEPREIAPVALGGERRDRADFRPRSGPRSEPRADRPERNARGARDDDNGWVPFRVTWGEAHGADPRRLVAMLCRRGQIKSSDIGAIRVARTSSTVEVAAAAAPRFFEATRRPDKRDSRVVVTPVTEAR